MALPLVALVGCRTQVIGPFDKNVKVEALVKWVSTDERPVNWFTNVTVRITSAITHTLNQFVLQNAPQTATATDSWLGPANFLGTARYTCYYKGVVQNYLDSTFNCAPPTAEMLVIPDPSDKSYFIGGTVHCANNAGLTINFFSQLGQQQVQPDLAVPDSLVTAGPPFAGAFGWHTEVNQPGSGNLGVRGTDHWGRQWSMSPARRFSGGW